MSSPRLTTDQVFRDLKMVFQTSTGRWRSDGHVFLTILKQLLHQNAAQLRNEDSETRCLAAVKCSAVVKLDLALATLAGRDSSDHLLDAVRLLAFASAAIGSGKVSVSEREYTPEESEAMVNIISDLIAKAKRLGPVKGRGFPPVIGSLAVPLRRAAGYTHAGALGQQGITLTDTSDAEIMDRFMIAHQ